MNIDDEILVNKYGQGLLSDKILFNNFAVLDEKDKRDFLIDMSYLIIQSKPFSEDVDQAIKNSNLKPTFTPCVLLKKGVANHVLNKIIELPENELDKVFWLFINLFKIAYGRRYNQEKNNESKWWYWDLSDESKVGEVRKMYVKNEAP